MVSTGKGACTCSFYHPDGKSILFASSHLNPTPRLEAGAQGARRTAGPSRYKWDFPVGMDIFRADPTASNPVRLTDAPGYDAEGSYSPDGKRIVFTSFRDGNAEIYVMDADGKNPEADHRQAKGYDGGPFFSPDGKKIIYRSPTARTTTSSRCSSTTPKGTAERALTEQRVRQLGAVRSTPTAATSIYATSRHGHQNYELYLMDTETGKRGADHLRTTGSTACPCSAPTAPS